MKKQLSAIKGELRQVASPAKAVILSSFFKTGKGQYGEGDLFLGVVVPTQRLIAKKHINATFGVVESLLQSKYHEERFTGLLILLYQFKKAKDELTRKNIYDFYLGHSSKVNNWDLVDVSCRDIVGSYLANKKRTVLYNLAKSSNMWERRIAIVSTMHFILQGDCVDALALSEVLLKDKEDLINKAVGWMLREVGKNCGEETLEGFLRKHKDNIPRVTLRYAIERMSEDKRKYFITQKRSRNVWLSLKNADN